MKRNLQPRIYVACLAAYNNGVLHGAWIDADQDEDTIMDEIREMLEESPGPNAEEWAIHDHEYLGTVHEYESVETVARKGALVAEHGEPALALLEYENDINYVEKLMEDGYMGEWPDFESYVQNSVEDTGEVPKGWISNYIDYESIANDWENSGEYLVLKSPNYEIFVFNTNV